jgi:hypothetical protein
MRWVLSLFFLLGLVLCGVPASALAQKPAKNPPTNVRARMKPTDETLKVMRLLQEPVKIKFLQDTVKLRQALEFFSEQFKGQLPIFVDKPGFNALMLETEDIYDENVQLPPTTDFMSMHHALRLIVGQLAKGQATFLIRNSQIEIVPQNRATVEYLLYETKVARVFDEKPLADVLSELSGLSGLTINLDPAVGSKGETLISASFVNSPLEEALVTISEQAELKLFIQPGSVFVTTPEKAMQLEKEERIRRKKREEYKQSLQPGAQA